MALSELKCIKSKCIKKIVCCGVYLLMVYICIVTVNVSTFIVSCLFILSYTKHFTAVDGVKKKKDLKLNCSLNVCF